MLGLTGAQGGGRDLDLTGRLVGLEGRGSASGADVDGKQVGALSPRGAGAGSIAPVVRLLLVVHGNQLEGGQRSRGQNTSARAERRAFQRFQRQEKSTGARLAKNRLRALKRILFVRKDKTQRYGETQWDHLEL